MPARRRVRIHEDHLDLLLGETHVFELRHKWRSKDGKAMRHANYRHAVHSLKTKPGALLKLTCRDELFHARQSAAVSSGHWRKLADGTPAG